MSTGRRQHFIPKFYLEQFFPGYCYRRGAKSPRYHRRAKKVAVQKDYYGGSEDDLNMLDSMNSFIENEAAPVLQRLVYDWASITRNDWVTLSYYFANMYFRTPAFHENMKLDVRKMTKQLNRMAHDMMAAVERAKAEGKDISVLKMEPDDGSPRFTLDAWNKWAEELETEPGRLRMTTVFYRDMKDITKYIQRMSIFILDAPGGLFFITTDKPLILLNMSTDSTLGAGWGNADVFAIHPLSPKHFMAMFYAGPATIRRKVLSADEVHFWNLEMVKYANREVYSKYPYDIALDWMHRRGQWAPPKKGKR
jgi:hypothetical protein